MIPNHWYAILEAKSLKTKPRGIKRLGLHLVLWRDSSGQVHCFPDRCSHRGAPLSQGRILNGKLECPYHGLQFDSCGRCLLIPANGRGKAVPDIFTLKPFPVREEHGFIWFWWGEQRESLPELPWFEEVPRGLSNSYTLVFEWAVSFRRVMGSMLDMHHFPFLHKKVSLGMGTLMNPYQAERKGDLINTWGNIRKDNGKSVEDSPGLFFQMSVRFPGIMHMNMTSKLQLLTVCAPIDEGQTWIAFRYYQKYLQIPIIGRMVAWLSAFIELKLVHPDDERMLRSLQPETTEQGANHLVDADRGIGLWLKMGKGKRISKTYFY